MNKSPFNFRLALIALLAMLALPLQQVSAQDDAGDTQTLQEYIDGLKFGIDDYAYGTAPGFVGDEQIYSDFFNTFVEANNMASAGTATAEEQTAMIAKLKAAIAKADSAIVPLTDGVYYIHSALTSLVSKGKMAWFAPRNGNYAGWKAQEAKLYFMWEVKKMADGNYSVRNMATGMYVNHNDIIDGQNKDLNLTEELETEQVFEKICPAGQFLIHCVGASWAYNAQNFPYDDDAIHTISNWIDKNVNGECAWFLTPVSAEDQAAAKLTENHDMLWAKVESFTGNYSVGTDPGQYGKDAYDALKAEVATAKEMLADATGKYTETDYAAELAKYDAAKAALDASPQGITDGYYAIATESWADYQDGKRSPALSQKDASDSWAVAPTWDAANPIFIWKIKSLDGDKYSVQNYASGLYLNSAEFVMESSAVNLAATETTAQIITHKKGEIYNLSNVAINDKDLGYSFSSDRVYLTYSPTSIYLHKFTDEEVAKIAADYPQRLRNDSLNALIANIYPRLESDSIYTTLDENHPIATNASQIYVNNLSTETPNVGNMIDGNTSTFVVSDWGGGTVTSDKDYHSIRIDAGEGKALPTNVGVKWTKRMDQYGATSRPTHVIFYASNDANTWVTLKELKNPDAQLPVSDNTPDYASPSPITMSKPYRYFKMAVIANASNVTGSNGKPYFSFAEFNLYPFIGEANPALEDEGHQALADLRSAIAAAQTKADAGTATSQDIADLQKAYAEFLLSYKDTADLYKMYVKATTLAPSVTPGDEPFFYPEEKVTAYEDAWAEVDEARPFTEIKQREVARLDTLLTRAYDDLVNSLILPDSTKWYTIKIADSHATDASGNSITGEITYINRDDPSGEFCAGGDNATAMMNDPRRAWKFVYTGEPGIYKMTNCGNGWSFNSGKIRFVPLGKGQFAILTGTNFDALYFINSGSLPSVASSSGVTEYVDSTGAWILEEAPEELTQTMSINIGRVYALCFPFETYAVPEAPDGTQVDTYKVCGYTLADDGKTVTGIKLTKWTEEGIPAGTPFVIKVGGGDASYSSDKVDVDFKAKLGGNVTRELTPQNGLYGTFQTIALPANMVYFTQDYGLVEPQDYILNAKRVYLNVDDITEDPNASVDLIVPINGTVQRTVTAINSATANQQPANVDVYTLDGVLVKRGVKAAEATNGLQKGVYIVGKRKVLVK